MPLLEIVKGFFVDRLNLSPPKQSVKIL